MGARSEMATLITQKAYAKRRRISAQYVNKLVRQGKIVLKKGLVDPAQADRAREHSRVVTPRRKQRGNAHGGGRPAGSGGAGAKQNSATATLTKARAADAGYQAELRKLELGLRTGELVPAKEVLEAERRKNANVRLRFRSLARSMAPVMARTSTPAECERILLDEIDHRLDELAEDPLGSTAAAPLQTSAEGAA
jgi:hypothetical protein